MTLGAARLAWAEAVLQFNSHMIPVEVQALHDVWTCDEVGTFGVAAVMFARTIDARTWPASVSSAASNASDDARELARLTDEVLGRDECAEMGRLVHFAFEQGLGVADDAVRAILGLPAIRHLPPVWL